MIGVIRRYLKRKMPTLRNWKTFSEDQKLENIFDGEQSVVKEFYFKALLDILNTIKGFFVTFTRFKDLHQIKRDGLQIVYGAKNIAAGIGFAFATVLSIFMAPWFLFSGLYVREKSKSKELLSRALFNFTMIPGLALYSAVNLLRGALQVVLWPLAGLAMHARQIAIAVKGNPELQENNGMRWRTKAVIEILKKNEPGSQGKLLNIFNDVVRKAKKADLREQGVALSRDGENRCHFEKRLNDINFKSESKNPLSSEQFSEALYLLNWMTVPAEPAIQMDYVSHEFKK